MTLDPVDLGANLAFVATAAITFGATVRRMFKSWTESQAEAALERSAEERASARRTLRAAVRRSIRSELTGFNARLERVEHAIEGLTGKNTATSPRSGRKK